MRGLILVGNTLDIFQHVLLETTYSKSSWATKEKAEKEYEAFRRESIRELLVDTTLGIIPIPFIALCRRIRAVKSEARKLGRIKRMKKYIYEKKKEAAPSLEELPLFYFVNVIY